MTYYTQDLQRKSIFELNRKRYMVCKLLLMLISVGILQGMDESACFKDMVKQQDEAGILASIRYNITFIDEEGNTILLYLFKNKQVKEIFLDALYPRFMELVGEKNNKGETVCMLAAQNNDCESLEILFKYIARYYKSMVKADNFVERALHMTFHTLKYLLSFTDKTSLTALHHVAIHGDVALCKILLEGSPLCEVNVSDELGYTPRNYAELLNKHDVAAYLGSKEKH